MGRVDYDSTKTTGCRIFIAELLHSDPAQTVGTKQEKGGDL